MANARTPGPQGTTGTATQRVADGTHGQFASPMPASQMVSHGVVPDYSFRGVVTELSQYAAQKLYASHLGCLARAYAIGLERAPAAVLKETGLDDLPKLLGALLKGLLIALITLAASTALGAVIGGVIGFFFGGVGAAPGAAIGAGVGLDVGVAILTWMGLGFLAVSIGKGMGDLVSLLIDAIREAWKAGDATPTQRDALVAAAGDKLARAVGVLIRLVIEGLVVYLTKGDAAKSAARVGELVESLKKSRLGEGFAAWFETNWARLVNDPKFNPALRATKNESRSAESASSAQTPSRAAGRRAEEGAVPRTPLKDITAQADGKTVAARRVREGTNGKVAVVGRGMDPAVKNYAAELRKAGYDVELFDGPLIPKEASTEWGELAAQYGGKIPDSELPMTKMYEANKAWAEKLVDKGYSVVDIGDPLGRGKSVCFDMEQETIFGSILK